MMNRVLLTGVSCCVLLAVGLIASADAKPKAASAPQGQKVQTIWDFQKELGLTEVQIKEMKGAVSELANYLNECRKRIASNEQQVQSLLVQNAEIEKIRPYLKSTADIQVEMRIADIKASQKINGTMTPEQLVKWREVQKRTRAQATAPVQQPGSSGEEEK